MNVQEMVNSLIKRGLTESGIAKQVGVTQGSINRIKHGAMPKYDLGCRIKGLFDAEHKPEAP